MCYFADTVVFEATVAWTSYPAGITAFEPGMKIHGQMKIPVATASGVRFLPFIRTSVFVKNMGSPDGKFMLLIFIASLPLVPANELLRASVTFPFTKYPRVIHVAIKRAVGLWDNYVHYGRDKAIRLDQKTIEIPPYVYAPGFKKCTITEISKGLFESLKDVEIIRLPKTINKIEWSFWNCRNLRSIGRYRK